MKKVTKLRLLILYSIILVNLLLASSHQVFTKDAYAHQLFNSSGEKIGNYYVQVATNPEIPTTGQNTTIMMRISSNDGTELSDVPISIEITKNGQEIDRIPQIVVTNGHYEFDYKFLESGNYVFYVYLQDIYFSGNTIKYTFNLSTLNPFGYIFFSLISFAVAAPFVVLGTIVITNRRRNKRMASNKSV
jgi:YtkA-like